MELAHLIPQVGRPHVITIPGSDRAFQEHVAAVEAEATTPDALERRLRGIFPLVVVRERALSGHQGWYVYRDGRWRPPDGTWWDDDALPRVVVSPEGWMVDANASAVGMLGILGDTVSDHHFTDFVVPGTLQDSESLFRLVEGGRELNATIRLRPQNAAPIAIELHAVRDEGGVAGVFRLATDVEPLVDEAPRRAPKTLVTSPASDVAFRSYVLRAVARMSDPTSEGLTLRVRRLYPHATTGIDGDRWIVERDPEALDTPEVGWWEVAGFPRVRYDRLGLILEADAAAEAYFGRTLVGHHWQEFVVPGTIDEVAVMLDILADVGAAASRFRMPRADGTLIEFDSYTEVHGDELVTVFRPADVDGTH